MQTTISEPNGINNLESEDDLLPGQCVVLETTYTLVGPYDEEAVNILNEALNQFADEGFEGPFEWIIDRHGHRKAKQVMSKFQIRSERRLTKI